MTHAVRTLGPAGFGAYEVDWSGSAPRFTRTNSDTDRILTPGFVDLHIHGAFGIDFMSATLLQMVELCDLLEWVGYEGFLPTTVAASSEAVRSALRNLPDHPMILGFHLEGPFLSPEYPGAQPVDAIVDAPEGPSDWDAVLDDPRLRVATIAPERPGASGLIRRLTSRGVIASMGHSNAAYAEAAAGWEAGVRHATHAFNAMRGFHHREAGAAGFVLGEPALRTELIYDRLHVSREAAALLLRTRPSENVIAVSDGTLASGDDGGGAIAMWGHRVVRSGGGLYLEGTKTLAGSSITLLDAFRNLCADFGAETAIRACSLNPRLALGLARAPRIYVEFDGAMNVERVHRVGP